MRALFWLQTYAPLARGAEWMLLCYLCVLGTFIVALATIYWQMQVDWLQIGLDYGKIAAILLFYGFMVVYRLPRQAHPQRMRMLLNYLWQITVLMYVFMVGVYLVPLSLKPQSPWIDSILTALDARYFWPWNLYAQVVEQRWWLFKILHHAYYSIWGQLVFLYIMLAVAQARRFYFLCCSILVTLGITLVISACYPSLTADVPATSQLFATHTHLDTHTAYVYYHNTVVPYMAETALIEFPSFHIALAIQCMYAARWLPWWARAVLWPLNVLMIIATPVIGVHYVTSCVAGFFVGIIGIVCTHLLVRAVALSHNFTRQA